MSSGERRIEGVLYGDSVQEIPVLGTLLLATSLHVMSQSDNAVARMALMVTALFAVISIMVPMIHRTYLQIKPAKHPMKPVFRLMASVSKHSIWTSLIIFILAVVLDRRTGRASALELSAWIVTLVVMCVILLIYRRELALHGMGDSGFSIRSA